MRRLLLVTGLTVGALLSAPAAAQADDPDTRYSGKLVVTDDPGPTYHAELTINGKPQKIYTADLTTIHDVDGTTVTIKVHRVPPCDIDPAGLFC